MEYAITTKDNPYSPFTDFNLWYQYDYAHGYGTAEKLARYSSYSDGLSPEMNAMSDEEAIDQIIKDDPLGIYIKLRRSDIPNYTTENGNR